MSVDFLIEESKIIQDVSILKPTISTDHRGNIWSSFTKECIESLLPDGLYFKHDKFSESRYNVLRGIHGDHKSWKLVTCVYGDIHQVVVDTRRDSSSFRKYQSFHINSKEPLLILLPPGVGNAYYVNSEFAVYHYKLAYKGDYLDADDQFTLDWNDAVFGIPWPTTNPILSIRDGGISNEID